LVKRYGAKVPLVVGPTIVALAYGLFMIPAVGGSYWTTFFPAMVVLGLGMAVSVAPLTTTVMNAVPEKRAGVASGVNNALSRIAGLLGIALLGIVVVHSFNRELDRRLATMELSPQVRLVVDAQRVKLAGAELSFSADAQPRLALKQAIDESFVFGFRLVMLTSLGLALASALVAFMVIENK
jgi:ABC-type multidrug transport system fused ATPase/permease subunit